MKTIRETTICAEDQVPARRFTFFAIAIVLFAIFARYQVSSELLRNDSAVSRPSTYTDMATYMKLSSEIASGSFKGEFYYQPFYYAVFLPLCHLLLGSSIWAVIISQIALSGATVLFSIISASLLGGRRAGLLAGFLAAFSAILIFYVPYHLIETLQAFWISLALMISILAVKRRNPYLWAAAGLVVGLAILTRGNAWFLLPGILLASILSFKGRGVLLRAAIPFIIIVAVIVPQIPFAVRNTTITGKFSGPSTAGPAVLTLGNTPEAPPGGRNPDAGPGPMEYPDTYKYWMESQNELSVIGRILDWFRAEPLAFLELQFRKLLLFWDGNEIPNNVDIYSNGARSDYLQIFGLIPSPLILSLGLAGFVIGIARCLNPHGFLARAGSSSSVSRFLLWYFIAACWLATAAFYNLTRFRLCTLPLLAVSSGIFLSAMIRTWRLRNWRILAFKYGGILAASLAVVGIGYPIYRTWEPGIMRVARPSGTQSDLGATLLVLDNGPYSFGGWVPRELAAGDEIIKIFAIEPRGESAKFAMPVVFKDAGRAVFTVNGLRVEIESPAAAFLELSTIVELLSDKISIRLDEATAPILVLCDSQRNYGRTMLNGYRADSELVSRIYIEKYGADAEE